MDASTNRRWRYPGNTRQRGVESFDGVLSHDNIDGINLSFAFIMENTYSFLTKQKSFQ
jgi:hypothetical protein